MATDGSTTLPQSGLSVVRAESALNRSTTGKPVFITEDASSGVTIRSSIAAGGIGEPCSAKAGAAQANAADSTIVIADILMAYASHTLGPTIFINSNARSPSLLETVEHVRISMATLRSPSSTCWQKAYAESFLP